MFKYYFFIIWEYLLILPKNLEMPSTGTPKIPRFKINVSVCECCCPFFIFCLSQSKKLENRVTYHMDVPLVNILVCAGIIEVF
jgi:hypothetical protein